MMHYIPPGSKLTPGPVSKVNKNGRIELHSIKCCANMSTPVEYCLKDTSNPSTSRWTAACISIRHLTELLQMSLSWCIGILFGNVCLVFSQVKAINVTNPGPDWKTLSCWQILVEWWDGYWLPKLSLCIGNVVYTNTMFLRIGYRDVSCLSTHRHLGQWR